MTTYISIHRIKSITTELKRFDATLEHETFSTKKITITDINDQKTTITLYADTNQELSIL